MENEIMTPSHRRWKEFTERLGGPEGCDFRDKISGNPESMIWNCTSKIEKPFASAILEKMGGVDIAKSLEYFTEHGGNCDCEILFNIDIPEICRV